jgi:hypothetical protein
MIWQFFEQNWNCIIHDGVAFHSIDRETETAVVHLHFQQQLLHFLVMNKAKKTRKKDVVRTILLIGHGGGAMEGRKHKP